VDEVAVQQQGEEEEEEEAMGEAEEEEEEAGAWPSLPQVAQGAALAGGVGFEGSEEAAAEADLGWF
jgi:hypothetical protein